MSDNITSEYITPPSSSHLSIKPTSSSPSICSIKPPMEEFENCSIPNIISRQNTPSNNKKIVNLENETVNETKQNSSTAYRSENRDNNNNSNSNISNSNNNNDNNSNNNTRKKSQDPLVLDTSVKLPSLNPTHSSSIPTTPSSNNSSFFLSTPVSISSSPNTSIGMINPNLSPFPLLSQHPIAQESIYSPLYKYSNNRSQFPQQLQFHYQNKYPGSKVSSEICYVYLQNVCIYI